MAGLFGCRLRFLGMSGANCFDNFYAVNDQKVEASSLVFCKKIGLIIWYFWFSYSVFFMTCFIGC